MKSQWGVVLGGWGKLVGLLGGEGRAGAEESDVIVEDLFGFVHGSFFLGAGRFGDDGFDGGGGDVVSGGDGIGEGGERGDEIGLAGGGVGGGEGVGVVSGFVNEGW